MRSNNKLILLFLLLLTIIVIGIALFIPSNSRLNNIDFSILDENNNFHYEVGEDLLFLLTDTTMIKNKKVVWEFGNGDTLHGYKNIRYAYSEPGKYLITMNVGKTHQVSKYLKIVEGNTVSGIDSIPKIYGLDEGYQGEELVFSADGAGVDTWYWEFGETGIVDAYEHQVIYKYNNPGTYQIKLMTNTTQYPVYHTIKILPKFEKVDATTVVDSLALVQDDIKEHLQAIANTDVSNQRQYYRNLNYIKNKYLCGDASNVIIVVNKVKYNDFHSYCQGLHFLKSTENKTIIIDKVEVDKIKCISTIKVTESKLE